MPDPTAPADAELVTRAARGEQTAFTALFERYADRVHDHVARWSRDATLAADATRAAFVALLGDLDAPREADVEVLPWLLRTARSHAVDQLRDTERTERTDQDTAGRVATAVLAATPTDPDASPEVATTTHDDAELVWEVAADLDARDFSVLDLHVRQELTNAEVATVLDIPRDDADVLVRQMRDHVQTVFGAVALLAPPTRDCGALESLRGAASDPMDLATARRIRDHAQECVTCGPRRARAASPLRVYAALAQVRAPVAVRTGVLAAAAERFGTAAPTSATLRRALPVGLTLLLLLAVVGGIAAALRSATPEPTDGPPTAAAEPVADPSPSPSPSPTSTLQALPSASPVPEPSPQPTVDPEPSPSLTPTPSPTPSPEPSPTVQPLAVAIEAPSAGEVVPATTQDDQGRQAARLSVAASVSGGGQDTSVAWTSDRAPDQVLLATAQGEVLLRLSDGCTDTAHVLTATATDETTGDIATASVQVQVTHTCTPTLTVSIAQPRSGEAFRRNPGSNTVTFSVAADVSDDDVTWTWTTSLAPGSPILTSQSGEVEVRVDDCDGSTSFTLFVDVERASDGSTAQHEVLVNVDCPV